ncbi:MAG: hypothetical protein WDO13_02615 [Verrucomicrobiota bacterium]
MGRKANARRRSRRKAVDASRDVGVFRHALTSAATALLCPLCFFVTNLRSYSTTASSGSLARRVWISSRWWRSVLIATFFLRAEPRLVEAMQPRLGPDQQQQFTIARIDVTLISSTPLKGSAPRDAKGKEHLEHQQQPDSQIKQHHLPLDFPVGPLRYSGERRIKASSCCSRMVTSCSDSSALMSHVFTT